MKLNSKDASKYLYAPVHTAVSFPRQIVTAALALRALSLPGDFVETGVYTGGMSVVMARVAKNSTKVVWACDSFDGLPSPQQEDERCDHVERRATCLKGARGEFRSSFDFFSNYLANEQLQNVRVVKGWFHDTLPPNGLEKISFLRLDGDLYNSTMVSLQRLYPLVVPRGIIYVDDYGSYAGCSRAVDKYLADLNVRPVFHKVRESNHFTFEAVWFEKA